MTSPQSATLPSIDQIIAHLEDAGIVPHVLSSPPHLKGVLEIVYPAGVSVTTNGTPHRDQVQDEPSIRFHPIDALSESSFYTLIMIDPDLVKTNDPINKQVRHWVVSGLKPARATSSDPVTPSSAPSSDLHKLDARTHTSFLPCAPMPMTGAHRYVFALAEEKQPMVLGDNEKLSDNGREADFNERLGFHLEEFAKEKHLDIVGVAFMKVAPTARSGIDDIKLMAESAGHVITGS